MFKSPVFESATYSLRDVVNGMRRGPGLGLPTAVIRMDHRPMPTISAFYGILIRMFFNDHPPPHFHARYGEFEATIDTATLSVWEGGLPIRA